MDRNKPVNPVIKMKKILFPHSLPILILLNLIFVINGQSAFTQITLENIWKERSFVPKTIRLDKSMFDGEHYSRVENDQNIRLLPAVNIMKSLMV